MIEGFNKLFYLSFTSLHWHVVIYSNSVIIGLFWPNQAKSPGGLSADLLIQRTEVDPRSRRNLLNRKRGSITHSLSLSSKHRPDMTEILLKRT